MQTISLVLFDMHDVLCRYDREGRIADLARLSGMPAERILAAIWTSGFEARADSGEMDAAAYLRGFGERLGYPITLKEWLANRKFAMTPMPEVIALMAAVKTRAEVAVLTNNHTLVAEHLGVLFPEVHALCGDKSYVSARFGAAKPDRQVYLRAAAAAGAAPAATLFIDDSQSNVDGALAAGLQALRFTDAPALRQALEALNLLPFTPPSSQPARRE